MLTRVFPPGVVDEVLAECGRTEQRHRSLSARTVAYFAIGMALHADGSYKDVLALISDGLVWAVRGDDPVRLAGKGAITHARKRLGAGPLEGLFRRVAVPLGGPAAGRDRRDVGDSFGPMSEKLRQATGEYYPYGVVTLVHEESNNSFNIPVSSRFFIHPFFDNDYHDLLDILSQGGQGGKLMPIAFLSDLDACIPPEVNTRPVRPDDLRPPSHVVGRDGRYFSCLRRPSLGGPPSAQNQVKTRMMIGDQVADYCLRHGLSSCWWVQRPTRVWTTEEISEMHHD